MDIFVTPFKIVNDPLVCQLLFHDEKVLEEVDDALINIEMVELSNHGLLVLEIFLILVHQSISLIDDTSNVVKYLSICMSFKILQSIIESLILSFFSLKLEVHGFYLIVVSFEFTENHLFIDSFHEFAFDFVKICYDFGQLLRICLLITSFLE